MLPKKCSVSVSSTIPGVLTSFLYQRSLCSSTSVVCISKRSCNIIALQTCSAAARTKKVKIKCGQVLSAWGFPGSCTGTLDLPHVHRDLYSYSLSVGSNL